MPKKPKMAKDLKKVRYRPPNRLADLQETQYRLACRIDYGNFGDLRCRMTIRAAKPYNE